MELPSVLYMLAQFIVNKLTGVAVCAAAIVFYFSGTMELTNCLLMLICSFILFEQLDSAGSFSALFRSIDIGVDKASAILRVEPMDIDGEELSPEREDITLSHVDFSYDSKPILHDVSLTIPEKTTVAIVGPSGSGKTTLCNLMARFWDVQGGCVRLGGWDVREYSYDSLIRNFSFVFQRTYLFSDTIANNIRFGKPDASMEEVLTRRFEHGLSEREELMAMETADGDPGNMERFGSFTRFPDLIMMDGGRGQVNIALEVLEEMDLAIPVCGMVKDDKHRTRGLYFRNVEIPIDRNSEGFKLITRVQDEAHRFAIEYHRLLRSKGQVHSILDDIPGIGPTRRKELMRHFQGIDDIKAATVEELSGLPGMNKKAAEQVYTFFHAPAQEENEDSSK